MKNLIVLSTALLTGITLAASPSDTLVIQSSADVITLDPAAMYDVISAPVIVNVYEPLLTYPGSSLKQLVPALATKWTASNGGKTYTFDLRQSVKFHNGDTMTCADAEYTFRRNLVTNESSSGNWFLSESLLGTQANANDDKSITWARITSAAKCSAQGQLVLNLPKVDPAFLSKLAYVGQGIVDRKYAASIGEWDGTEATWKSWVGKDLSGSALNLKPNGTGPYKLVRRDAGNLLFTAHDSYWGGKPSIKNVLRQNVPELAARQQAFLRGDADMIDGGGRAVDEAQLKGRPGVTWVDDLPNTNTVAVFMNQNIKNSVLLGSGKLDGKGIPANFFSDVDVRRAFSYLFNYAQYTRDVFKGQGINLTMMLPPTFPGYDPKISVYQYDPKQAEAAFKRAFGGNIWKNGFTFTANYRAGSTSSQTALELLKQSVEALNPKFRLNLQPKQASELSTDAGKGMEPMTVLSWSPDYADPDNFMYTFYSSDGWFSPRSNFKDATIDRWLIQARATTDVAQRNKLYSQVGRRAHDLAPVINLPQETKYLMYSSRVGGAPLTRAGYNPLTFLPWAELRKK
ncbi:ABC transporter substrate-binding protein [Deinococcus arenicola]|uniref:ABC transporter substrate-binding protein n=1 Tax=Deinococcus arenicola TaxID=2994950 RepID=A0ABU4DXC6_9DEIO|nr:ABC transporter substrate-binding protein [Deinococcus sp. ZS9-10]MDV6376612.1 ABC transporter substrate-binding protein [Deinococcus sp. ZS9-10]